MNTASIKKYAHLARNPFITAVTKRANELGIYAEHIEEAIEEGQVLKIEGRSVDLNRKGACNKRYIGQLREKFLLAIRSGDKVRIK